MTASVQRRRWLTGAFKLLLLIGLGLLAIPFLGSLSSGKNDTTKQKTDRWVLQLDISTIAAGQLHALHWQGRDVWVYHRYPDDISALQHNTTLLRDAMSQHSHQPEGMATATRSFDPRYFVFVPQENKRGCQVSLAEDTDNGVRFTEPCYGAKYDAAGRIFTHSGHAEQRNLMVPVHKLENGKLYIAAFETAP